MTLGRFDNATASDVSAGLAPPTQIRKSDVDAVRKNYGIASTFKPKGMSDTSLYAHSVKFVLDWWKKNSPAALAAQAAAAAKPVASPTGTKAPAPITSPGTVVKAPTTAPAPLAKPTVNQAAVTQGVTNKVATMTKVIAPPAAPAPLTTAQASSIMTQMGLRGVTPPKSALVSTTALRAWVTSQLSLQKQQTATATRLTSSRVGL